MATKESAQRYLSFSLGVEEYAIPLLKVKEVIAVPETTPVPFTPTHFLGMMNLRGQVISVIDLRLKLGMPKSERTEETAVIIVDLNPIFLGVVVDSVNKVLSLEGSEVSAPPELLDAKNSDYLTGVARKDSKLILILEIAKALDVQDMEAISQTVTTKAS